MDKKELEKLEQQKRQELEKLIEKKSTSDKIHQDVPNLVLSNRKHEHRVRYAIVAKHLLQGYSASQIADKFHQKWNIQPETIVRVYCPGARKAMREDMLTSLDDMITDVWLKYDHVYQRFHEMNDVWGMKSTLDAKMRMLAHVGMGQQENVPIQVVEVNIIDKDNIDDEGQTTD